MTVLVRAGIRIRKQVEVRIDRSPREQVEAWAGRRTAWCGRAARPSPRSCRPGRRTPGVHCAGASVAATSGLPYAALTAAVVAEEIGAA